MIKFKFIATLICLNFIYACATIPDNLKKSIEKNSSSQSIRSKSYDKKWNAHDTTLGAMFALSAIVDFGQTRDLVKHPERGCYELNPILGKYPSESEVNVYFPIAIMSVLAFSNYLPSNWRSFLLSSALMVELKVIDNNQNIGWRMNF